MSLKIICGNDPEKCPHWGESEICYKHTRIDCGTKIIAAIIAPAFAVALTIVLHIVDSKNTFWTNISKVHEETGFALHLVCFLIFCLWALSFLAVAQSRLSSFKECVLYGVCLPFTLISAITPLINAAK